MGIVEEELASFRLSEFGSCRIERNSSGSIHLHLDGLRIELSAREFEEFARVVRKAREELEALKSDDGTHGVATSRPR